MSDPSGPTVRRRRLGSELRRLRERARLDQAAAARHLECSTSKISRLETGQGLAKVMEIRSLLDLYDVTEETEREAILTLHKTASQVGWWEQAEYEEVLPSGL
ncbi:helix-turn-helix domain-containing protein, partial [Streptomyces sp. NPDC002324]